MDYPVTPAIRILREHKVAFEPIQFTYLEKGGTAHSSSVLGVDQHIIVKTLIMEDGNKAPLCVLMHGDFDVSTKNLARQLGIKTIQPCKPEVADKHSGYQVGGTSPFGLRQVMPIYVEESILELNNIYINGGKRGFLVSISPTVLIDVLKAKPVRAAAPKTVVKGTTRVF
jgi:Cys-tRNA(Pro) deacylase